LLGQKFVKERQVGKVGRSGLGLKRDLGGNKDLFAEMEGDEDYCVFNGTHISKVELKCCIRVWRRV
jgi:hypothetical protein